jgi:hypothetical protein
MLWSEAQSVIQLAAALNAIYLSLREIRNPYVRNEQDALSSQDRDVRELFQKLPPALQTEGVALRNCVLDNQVLFQSKLHSFNRADAILGAICAILIVIYVILLIVSAFKAHDTIGEIWAYVINIAGFLPVLAGLLLNLALIDNLKDTVAAARHRADLKYMNLNARLTDGAPVTAPTQ